MIRPQIVAHRGASADAPENTMPAFRLAVEVGADGIETDAHLTSDGHIVLIHDENTLRTTGFDGEVGDLTLAELRKLDAGSWFGSAFAGTPIPELWELLELLQPTKLTLNIELKNGYRNYPGLEAAVLGEVARYGMADQVYYSSFNHRSLAIVTSLQPAAQTALLYGEIYYDVGFYAQRVGATALHPYWRAVDQAAMADAKSAGLVVRPWTVDDPETAHALAALGVDALITNCPAELLASFG